MIQQLLRFAFVGVIASVVYFALAALFYSVVGLPTVGSSIAAYSIAAIVSFVGHRNLTFSSSQTAQSEIGRFMVVTVVGLLLATIVPATATGYFGLPSMVSFILVLAVVPICSYLMMRFFVFSKGQR